MANIKSQIKRNRQNEKRRVRNRNYISSTRTFVKKARLALDEGGLEAAKTATIEAVSALDQAAERGVLHRNNASRRKSRLMKQLAALEKKSA